MERINAGHVKRLEPSISRTIKKIKVSEEIVEDGVPTSSVQEGEKVGDARYQLDKSILKFNLKQKWHRRHPRQCRKTRGERTSNWPR